MGDNWRLHVIMVEWKIVIDSRHLLVQINSTHYATELISLYTLGPRISA